MYATLHRKRWSQMVLLQRINCLNYLWHSNLEIFIVHKVYLESKMWFLPRSYNLNAPRQNLSTKALIERLVNPKKKKIVMEFLACWALVFSSQELIGLVESIFRIRFVNSQSHGKNKKAQRWYGRMIKVTEPWLLS